MKEVFIIKILSYPPRAYFRCLASSDGDYFTTANVDEAQRFATRQEALDTLEPCIRHIPGGFTFEICLVLVIEE